MGIMVSLNDFGIAHWSYEPWAPFGVPVLACSGSSGTLKVNTEQAVHGTKQSVSISIHSSVVKESRPDFYCRS